VESNTLQDTRPGERPYYIHVVYWEDRDCGYREVTTPDEWYDYQLSKFVMGEREVLRVHKPRAPLPVHQQPEYLRNGIAVVEIARGQQTIEGSA
jgi:hypothetical protein